MALSLRPGRSKLTAPSRNKLTPKPKQVDPFYQSAPYLAWREAVISRAGRQCEDVDERTGLRCTKAEPRHRMFADHIKERRDGGDPLDLANGRCRCGAHHSRKTAAERAARSASSPR